MAKEISVHNIIYTHVKLDSSIKISLVLNEAVCSSYLVHLCGRVYSINRQLIPYQTYSR